ncbi:hypothetical protein ACFFSW_05800 [Saccharothrix longispora]|uniref:Uncharacterized protein n=1 Tax=Saccharothrix longispora TaxID=33920 RepID=A0ABU1PTL1_9PSEU|nr:hypothetical protein [Saccharothrix longispora]
MARFDATVAQPGGPGTSGMLPTCRCARTATRLAEDLLVCW